MLNPCYLTEEYVLGKKTNKALVNIHVWNVSKWISTTTNARFNTAWFDGRITAVLVPCIITQKVLCVPKCRYIIILSRAILKSALFCCSKSQNVWIHIQLYCGNSVTCIYNSNFSISLCVIYILAFLYFT